ncbi:sigma-70 family RNA polymerase sigma factor [Microcella daejeonensis]|uniref:RNA polymerase sigma factor n=1 Tax=Microcella daejeonensis TaxID=2994971 RepID=A0A9E8MKX6_9MICO|nr:sigma-70 family RNA polymerase sigma factor [Microcella daejeonensis]WAB81408.1 sigma-70 family RNA polymerase sigma factor [Microcella daejeonensis]
MPDDGAPAAQAARRAVEAVWRIESPRLVASLVALTRDVDLAEDLAQEALVDALRQWPEQGVPRNPGAWLTAVAKRRAIDGWRRRSALDERYRGMAAQLEESAADPFDPIDDEMLRLVFLACHPVLTVEAQTALTLKLVAGLTSEQLARLFLVPVATMQQRIVRAKKALTAARAPFEVPDPSEWTTRLGGVLAVVYLVFTEGYAPTTGTATVQRELADEALRLGRRLAALLPREPEVHGLLALMELQRSRFAARTALDGSAILLEDQDRRRWDAAAIARGRTALARADAAAAARRTARGGYALQAAIAEQHAVAPSVAATDWAAIVLLYEVLGRAAPSPIVELNRAVAVSMSEGPATALRIVDGLAGDPRLGRSALLPGVRGELLTRLGRVDEARAALLLAAERAGNERQRAVLLAKASALDPAGA